MLAIFLDTETNGLNPYKHVVLDIAFIVKDLVDGKVKKEFEAGLSHPQSVWAHSDPGSLSINGLSPEILEGSQSQEEVGEEIVDIFEKLGVRRKKAVFICQNPSFDRAFFSQLVSPELQEEKQWPYHWLDLASMYFILELSQKRAPWETGLSKDEIAVQLGLEKEAAPHRAMQGCRHLLLCFEALQNRKFSLER